MDFETVKMYCLTRNELWEDPEFPAVMNSIFYFQKPPFNFVWKRPREIFMEPTFITMDNRDTFDVVSGKLGDRWMVSCLGMLYQAKGLLFHTVPVDQAFDESYCGVFRFRIWWCGQWKEVMVDDKLPTINDRLVFVHSSHSPQVWAALLEKAYAKLHGSYEALKYGNLLDGLADMTGGITESYRNIRNVPFLAKVLSTCSFVTAQYSGPAGHLGLGLEPEMHYRIYRLQKVETSNGSVLMVLLKRPPKPGSPDIVHYVNDAVWQSISLCERGCLLTDTRGVWMLYRDFRQYFTRLQIIHYDAETSKVESALSDKVPWHVQMYKGSWKRGVSAGGCRNKGNFFHMNPQIQLVVFKRVTAIVSLSQNIIMEPKVIGFTIYKIPTLLYEAASEAYFTEIKSKINSHYTNSRQVSYRCELEAGIYLLIPTTFEPREEAQFTLRVYTNGIIDMTALDHLPQMLKPAFLKAPPNLLAQSFVQYEPCFLHLANEHRTIDVYELQELLENCLPNDYIKSCATLDTCRQFVLSMDVNGSGRLTLQNFRDLICSLRHWQTIFKTHTVEKMGVLRAERLRTALYEVGFVIPEQILSLLVLRYMRKDGLLRFGDFVSAVMHLHRAFSMFKAHDNGHLTINITEWLKCIFMC
ncbi:calpain-C-like isoform X2 [Achroia grisella]|uniref:calpain-C-like isoform X2 n=1 Tax=Achroia grisella TaxID=688607 RepID=UPI0027D1F91D|nr:calpain-C-like isoform X2 [Achroia grisella]